MALPSFLPCAEGVRPNQPCAECVRPRELRILGRILAERHEPNFDEHHLLGRWSAFCRAGRVRRTATQRMRHPIKTSARARLWLDRPPSAHGGGFDLWLDFWSC